MKILGREPALWIGGIVALFAALAAFNIPGLSAGQAYAIGGVLVAALVAATTRPVAPGAFTGLLTAAVALLAEYGTTLSEGQVASLGALVLALFTLITRQQVSPAAAPPRRSGDFGPPPAL